VRTAVTLDRASPLPLTRQIYDFWRLGILHGRFPGGQRVPSTREAAENLGLARGTVGQAYEQLVGEGYLEAVRGSGTFVCRQLPDRLLEAPEVSARGAARATAARLSSFGKRLAGDFQRPARLPGHISLSEWGPDLSLFPWQQWHRCYARSLRSFSLDPLSDGRHVRGYAPLCEEIAGYVARSRGVSCGAGQVIVVNGSQQALDLCARLLLDRGDEVLIENPGYVGASRIFAACGARLRPVAVDGQGIVCSRLSRAARLAYVTPAHQFPTGASLSLRRRLELIGWARRHGAVIIEDDYDSEYRYSGAPMPALQGLASGAAIVYCGTFSTVMFPGLRLGYLIVPPALVAAFERAKWLADRHTPLYHQAALCRFMREGHLERHIRRMRRTYGLRHAALVEALEQRFGGGASILGEAAGLHAYVRFDDPNVAERAARNKVQLRSVAEYFINRAPCDEYVLGFSMLAERTIREAIRRLAP
jgi:GntR family transcriptional regulator / MocR family aminotransferase